MTRETQECGSSFQEWYSENGMLVAELAVYRLGPAGQVLDYTASAYSHHVNDCPTYIEKTFAPSDYTTAQRARAEALRWILSALDCNDIISGKA